MERGMESSWPGALFTSPVLRSVSPWAARLAERPCFPSVAELDEALRDRLAWPPAVALEPQVKARRRRGPVVRDALYELRIHTHRRVPTRERSWHDLTNALVWAAFPRSKRALVARQHAITSMRVAEDAPRLPTRNREQDALAMLDEGGIVVLATASARDAAIVAQRAGEEEALAELARSHAIEPLVFGHALMEHAVRGELDVRGYGVVLVADLAVGAPLDARIDAADRSLAHWIVEGRELAAPAPWRALPLTLAVARAGE